MLLKFIGLYTGGRNTITYGGVTFEGYEPAEVSDPVLAQRLLGSEFEEVDPLDHDGDGEKGGSLPKRGRKPKEKAE